MKSNKSKSAQSKVQTTRKDLFRRGKKWFWTPPPAMANLIRGAANKLNIPEDEAAQLLANECIRRHLPRVIAEKLGHRRMSDEQIAKIKRAPEAVRRIIIADCYRTIEEINLSLA